MRALLFGDADSLIFSNNKILDIGEGKHQQDLSEEIEITPEIAICVSSATELEDIIYNELNCKNLTDDWLLNNSEYLMQRGILCPTNDEVDNINDRLLSKLPGNVFTYLSSDTMEHEEDIINYPIEYLNTLNPSGIAHKLQLKVGAPIMILRNLRPPLICNGTRGIIKSLSLNVIQVHLAKSNEVVFIPRLPIILQIDAIKFSRTQFPIRLCFAMTINKSQGQSMKLTGVNLTKEPFAHGQFYVSISRTGSAKSLFIFAEKNKTRNVVYKDVINDD